MADIFISYSRHDLEPANALVAHLRERGYEVWIDVSGIEAATSWSKEIVRAVESCRAFVLLLSEVSLSSSNVAKEVAIASELEKAIIPIELEVVQLRDQFLYHLAGLQRVHHENLDGIAKALENLGLHPTKRTQARTDGRLLAAKGGESPESSARQAYDKSRLAVLPFEDQSPAKDNEWFADGMMDELINTLGALKQLHVNPRGDVLFYKHTRPKLEAIAVDLNCRYVVEGSVQKSGEKIRIRVALSDAREHTQVWSAKYDGTFDDIFDFQEKTAKSIADALRLTLAPEDEKEIAKNETENSEAYAFALKGSEYFHRMTMQDSERAIQMYEEALKLDPDFATAHIELALACQAYHRHYSKDAALLIRATSHVDRAEEIEGETARVDYMRSYLELSYNRLDEALRYGRRAIEIDPKFALGYDAVGFALQALGRRREAAEVWKENVALLENSLNAHFCYLLVLHELGETEQLHAAARTAISVAERHLRLSPDDSNARVLFANFLGWGDQRKRALEEAKKVEDEAERGDATVDGFALYNLACFYLHEGLPERALPALRLSIKCGLQSLDNWLIDPDLDPLRPLPEFQEITAELERIVAESKRTSTGGTL